MNKAFYKPEYLVIFILITVKLAIHITINMNAGFDGDEILQIDSGNHIAWGYMTIQPIIGLLAWIQNLLNSSSVFVHHLFPHITAILIMIFSGIMVMRLGGGWKAVLLALSCILVAPGFTYSNHIFTPLVFEQFFWLLSFYTFIRYCEDSNSRHFIYLSIFLAFGFLVKISILILIAGIGISILIYKRDLFSKKIFWLAFGVFLLIISPNIIWQYQHNFPSVDHMVALHDKMLVKIDIIDNLRLLFLTTNPFTAIVWLTAILFALFIKLTEKIRVAVVAMISVVIILAIFRGQFHYYFPIVLIAFCIGSVIIEHYLKSKTKVFWLYILILITSGIYLIPRTLPILPLDKYIKHLNLDKKETRQQNFFTQQSIAENKKINSDKRIPINFEAFYTHNDWLNLLEAINKIYQTLPQYKKKKCYIWTRCYTQAGGINLHRKKFNLPEAFSQHGNYHEWIPKFDTSATIIVVANAKSPADSIGVGSFFATSFDRFNWKDAVFCPYARTSSNAYYMLYLGEGLKYNSDTLKLRYKDYIFE